MSGRCNVLNDRQEEDSSLLHPPAGAFELNNRLSQPGSSNTLVDGSGSDGEESRAPLNGLRSRGGEKIVQGSQITTTVQDDVGPSSALDSPQTDLTKFNADLDVTIVQMNYPTYDKQEFGMEKGASLEDWIESFDAEKAAERGLVTWINVNGFNGLVLDLLRSKFNVHDLALKDAVDQSELSHSKASWYPTLLYARLLVCALDPSPSSPGKEVPGFSSPVRSMLKKLKFWAPDATVSMESSAEEGTLSGRKQEDGSSTSHSSGYSDVPWNVQQLSIFLTESGVVISVFQNSGNALLKPVFSQLKSSKSILRTMGQPSMIFHALIDSSVTQLMKIGEACSASLLESEKKARSTPSPEVVRELHFLNSELLQLQRVVDPIRRLVLALKDDDERRGKAVSKPSSPESWKRPKFLSTINDDVAGHLSCEARLYLQDVDDQLATLYESLELFSSRASEVVDWCYNQMSFDTNVQVTKLTFVTVFGLPLSLVTACFDSDFVKVSNERKKIWLYWLIMFVMCLCMFCYYCYLKIKVPSRTTKQK